MEIGVSTACLYPLETELALEELGKLGVRAVELFFNSASELKPEFLKRYRDLAGRYGLRIVSLHPYTCGFEPFLFFTNYERRFRDGLDEYDRFYQAANKLGAGIFVIHGDRKDGLLPETEVFDRFGEMFRRAKAQGVVLAQENVERSRSRGSAYIRRMRDYLGGDVRFVLDLKQAQRAGEDPFDMLDAMGDRLVHLHLSDSLPGEACLPPGAGNFDFARLFRLAQAAGYGGCGIVELYRQNYRGYAELYAAQQYLCGVQRNFFD